MEVEEAKSINDGEEEVLHQIVLEVSNNDKTTGTTETEREQADVAYFQVEEEETSGGKTPGDVVALVAEEELEERCLVQSQTDYREVLLENLSQNNAAEGFLDLPVFCSDGLVWSSRLVLASLSPMLKSALQDSGEESVVLPDLTRNEFSSFQRALFVKEEAMPKLDFFLLIKVAETIGADLALTTSFPENRSLEPPSVDYRNYLHNAGDRKKLAHVFGNPSPASSSSFSLSSILEGGKWWKCEKCRRVFIDHQSLQSHMDTVHSSNAIRLSSRGSFECPICYKSFMYAASVERHKWLCHRRIDKKSVIQTIETSEPRGKQALKRKRLEEKLEDMKCKICGFNPPSWRQLQVHMMDHTNERPYKCDVCGKGFKEAQKLKRHSVTHTGEKKFKCETCGRAFGLKHNLKSHEKIHRGEGKFCSYCGKVFSQVTNFREHERLHARSGHIRTEDETIRKKQAFVKTRGRPSMADLNK